MSLACIIPVRPVPNTHDVYTAVCPECGHTWTLKFSEFAEGRCLQCGLRSVNAGHCLVTTWEKISGETT